jgi:ligand-binding SRPBCC domain-containing protein
MIAQGRQKVFEIEQFIPKKPEEVFPFFSDAKNLEKITPPWLHFRILDQSTPQIQEGTVFNYQLRIRGFPVKWRSRIENWQLNKQFVDTQLRGPYKLWHHTHLFEEIPGGTKMIDRVIYELPLGLIGDLFGRQLVRKDVKTIFDYRYKIIREIFGDWKK